MFSATACFIAIYLHSLTNIHYDLILKPVFFAHTHSSLRFFYYNLEQCINF